MSIWLFVLMIIMGFYAAALYREIVYGLRVLLRLYRRHRSCR